MDSNPIQHPGRAYLIAVGVSVVVAVVRLALSGVLGGFIPFIPFTAAVAIAAWYGGLRPGIVATILGAVAADSLFVPPRYAMAVDALRAAAGLSVFLLVGVLISWLCELLHRGRHRLEAEREQLKASAAIRARMQESLRRSEELERARVLQLEALTRALTESDQRKNEFLIILAHELRNPLAPIRNLVHILRAKAVATPDLTWMPELIERQVSQMNRLVDDLTEVSRLGRSDFELRIQRVELTRLLQGAAEAARPLIEAEGHELEISLPDEPVYLDADLTRLSQVFSNLLRNAAKYTERGGQIALVCELVGGDIEIYVRDTGIGIPADMLERIFEPFVQLEHSRGRSQGGLGIGLTLAKHLVQLHGGSLAARSDGVGRGSELVARLPVRPATAVDESVAVPRAAEAANVPFRSF